MNEHEQCGGSGDRDPDRQLIQVDCSADQAGIAAALRRAFEAGPPPRDDDSFADLLERLH